MLKPDFLLQHLFSIHVQMMPISRDITKISFKAGHITVLC